MSNTFHIKCTSTNSHFFFLNDLFVDLVDLTITLFSFIGRIIIIIRYYYYRIIMIVAAHFPPSDCSGTERMNVNSFRLVHSLCDVVYQAGLSFFVHKCR